MPSYASFEAKFKNLSALWFKDLNFYQKCPKGQITIF